MQDAHVFSSSIRQIQTQYEVAASYRKLLEPYNIVFHFESLLDLN